MIFCISPISFSRFLIILTIIILSYISGSLPISSSFIWTSVFLICFLTCVVFLCFFTIIFLTYCVWGLFFPGLKFEFFFPFGFCPRVRFVLSFCLFICLIFLWWARLSEVVILSADDWVSIFVLFVVWMRCPAQGATCGWVMLGLVFQWFPLCEFSLFDTP